MESDVRRLIAVDAHRRRTGRCPSLVYSLGTGEAFAIEPRPEGFRDVRSGLEVRADATRLTPVGLGSPIDIAFTGDVAFAGFDHASNERFTGRAGGGASVTIYDADDALFFQYAIGDAAARD